MGEPRGAGEYMFTHIFRMCVLLDVTRVIREPRRLSGPNDWTFHRQRTDDDITAENSDSLVRAKRISTWLR